MGNIISSVQGFGRFGWWHSAEHRKVILNASDLSHNPTASIASGSHSDVNCTESDSESNKYTVRNITRTLSPEKADELEEFRRQLAIKREARKKLIASKSDEMETLRENLNEERRLREEAVAENIELRAQIARNNVAVLEANVSEREAERQENNRLTRALADLEEQSRTLRAELSEANYALQSANAETALFEKENFELKKAIRALKEVKKVSKEMLDIRESQLAQLKEKLSDIEKSLADREMKTMSDELKREYERQLENIRNLRTLYEERARMSEVTRLGLLREVDEHKSVAESRTKKCEELEARVEELEKQLSDKDDVLVTAESQLGFSKAETKGLQAEMTVINQLFSQMLLGYNSNQDLDKLLLKLEENHDLLTDMVVREDCSEMASALPKLILDLVNQIDASEIASADIEVGELDNKESSHSEDAIASSSKSLTSAKEIVGNLPKVWRVLTELLSHQSGPPLVVSEISEKSSINCYKSVDTPSGPRMVPSVSKTYIRLKDLILEKKSLQKEMNRLKQLNSHLENRLQDQGRRLGLVSSELGKTWHVVGRMERQHQQLHTHEKILRYELQQKRKLLTELKEELEFCKDKWDRAKQKNSESQIEWDKLRVEFASRKVKSTESVSAESGYSDEDSDASEEKKSERRRSKKKAKSPEINAADKTICAISTQDTPDEMVDSDIPQDEEEIPNDSICTTSDNEIHADLADTEDQSNSETLPTIEVNSEEETPNSQDESAVASSSTAQNNGTCYDNVLATRSARLKKLEEQCYVLVNKVTKTNNKGIQLCNKLEELHNQYGGPDPSTSSPIVTELNENRSNDRLAQDPKDATIMEEDDRTPALTESTEISETDRLTDIHHTCSDTETLSKENATDTATDFSKSLQDEKCTVETVNDLKEDCVGNNPCQNRSEINEEIKDSTGITDTPVTGKSSISEYESRFAARDERLKRLEEQAKSLVNKVSNTSTRSVEICSKLDELHNTYGKSEEKQKDNSADDTSETRPSTSGLTNEQQMPDTSTEAQSSDINSSLEQRNNEQE